MLVQEYFFRYDHLARDMSSQHVELCFILLQIYECEVSVRGPSYERSTAMLGEQVQRPKLSCSATFRLLKRLASSGSPPR